VICAMEMGKRITPEVAYKMIKEEIKDLKKVRKEFKNDPTK